jgi:formate--tetrahydrofolate ligase
MKLDPTSMKNWEIAEVAEKNIKPIFRLAEEMGLQKDELLPAGHTLGKVHFMKVLDRLKDAHTAKYIDVTAITPTPFGEGKTTTTIGLIQGFGKCGKRSVGVIRQPSAGPAFRRIDVDVNTGMVRGL